MPQYSRVTIYKDDDVTPLVTVSTDPTDNPLSWTNQLPFGNDLADPSWIKTGLGTATKTATGVNGEPNTASIITDIDPAARTQWQKAIVIPANTAIHTAVFRVMKDTNQARFPIIAVNFTGGTTQSRAVSLNTQTGAMVVNNNIGTTNSGVVDMGDHWAFWISITGNGTNTGMQVVIQPAYGSTINVADVTVQGGMTIGNVEIYFGTNGAFPDMAIFTKAAAVTQVDPYPYLQEDSLMYGESKIDFPNGAAGIGQFSFKLLDKRTNPTDQGTGFFTALLSDTQGRGYILGHRVLWRRQQIGSTAYTTQFDGFADDCVLDDDLVEYKIPCRDTRERERTNRIFTKAPASNPTVLVPNGPLNGWGTVPGTTRKMIPAVVPLQGVFHRDANVPGSAGRVKCNQTQFDLIITGDRYQALQQYGALTQGTGLTGGDTSLAFRQVEVWWRAYPGGGAWNKLSNMPAVYGTDYPMNNVFPLGQGTFEGAESRSFVPKWPKDKVNFLINMTGPGIPADNQAVEVMVVSKGQPTDAAPIYWEGNLGQLCKDIYDGVYSDYMPGIRYDATAMANFIQKAPSGYAIISQPEDNGLQWAQENIYKPTGWAPSVPPETGLVTPIQYNLPDATAPLLQITDSITKEDAKWQLNKDELINQVTFQYQALYIRDSKYLTNFADKLGTNANLIEPPAQRIGGIPIYYQEIAVNSQALLGSKELKYNPVTINLLGTLTPNGLDTKLWPDVGAKLAKDRTREVLDRFTFGGQDLVVNVRRLATGVQAARMGDWAQVSLSWLPDYVTDRRGLNRLMQIIAVNDDDKVFRKFTLSDAGPNAQASPAPTLGAITQANGVLDIPFSAIPAGVTAQVDYAVAAIEPAADSGVWTNGGRTTAVGTHILIGPFDPGVTVWVRARGEQAGLRRSAYVASVSTVITNAVAVLNLQLTFDADGHPRASWTVPTSVLGMRIYYITYAAGTDPAALTTFVDVDATLGQVQIPIIPKVNEYVAIRAVPYPGFAAGAVSGVAGAASDLITGSQTSNVDPNMPVAEEITSTVGMVGTLTLQITDPQNRLTQVEFSHQSGDGAWSSWAVDSATPYADSVNLLESKTSKIAYRLTAYDENGVLTIFKTNEVSFSLGAAPAIPQVSLSINPSNHLIMTYFGDERTASIKYYLAVGVDPVVTTIRTGTIVNGRSGSVDLGTATTGADYHMGILAYSGASATGVESQPAYSKFTWTNPATAQPLPPTITISMSDITAPTLTAETVRFDAALGIGSTGTLQWRRRTYTSTSSAPAWGAFSATPALPFELTVTRALKWDTILEAQATDGVRTTTVRYSVMSKMGMLNDSGQPQRATQWDDTFYSPVSISTNGLTLHGGTLDSRSLALNTHFNTASHTADNVPTGAVSRVVPFSVLRLSDNALLSSVDRTASIAGANAEYVSRSQHSVFLETFDAGLPTYTYRSGSAANLSIVTGQGVAGGKVLRADGYVWLEWQYNIPFDPSKLYRMRVRARRNTGTMVMYAGLVGVQADGVSLMNVVGANSSGSQHYVVMSGTTPTASFVEYTGYIKGNGTTYVPNASNPLSPSNMYTGVAYIRPLLILNYSTGVSGTDQMDVDEISIDVQDEDNANRTYQTISSGGNVKAGRVFDDSAYAVMGTTRTATHASVTDSRSLALNTHFNTASHTMDNVPEGGTYGKASFTRLGYSDRAGLAINSGGNLISSRVFDDGGLAVIGSARNQIYTSVTDSRSYAINAHYNTSVHTIDNTTDGATRFAAPVVNATSDSPIYTASAGMSVRGNTFSNTSGGAWTEQVYTLQGYFGPCYVDCLPRTSGQYAMIGLNTDPTTDASYTSLDYAWYTEGSGTLYIYESGVLIGSYGTWSTTTQLTITYDGINVRYFKDGNLMRTVTVSLAGTLSRFYLDSSYNGVGAGFTNVRFGTLTMSSQNDNGYIYRTLPFHDGLFAVRGDELHGWSTHTSVFDARGSGYRLADDQNNVSQTMDNLNDGGIYSRVSGVVGNLITYNSVTRRYSAFIYATVAQTIGNNSWTDVLFDSEVSDQDNMHSTTSDTQSIYIPAGAPSGAFLVIGSVEWAPSATNYREIRILMNTSTIVANNRLLGMSNSGLGHSHQVSGIGFFAGGTRVRLQAFQNTGGNLNTVGGSTATTMSTWLAIIHLW